MKNILFVHSGSELYGSDRSLLNVVKYLDKNEFRVYVVLPAYGLLADAMQSVENVHVDIFDLAVLRRKNLSLSGGIRYLKDFAGSVTFLKHFIREYGIDVVYTNTAVVFPGAIAAKRCGIKSIWHVREIIRNDYENKFISMVVNRYSDVIVANSEATARALMVNQNKVRIIYNAVEDKAASTRNVHKNLVIGMAGRINRWKGQSLFVHAAAIVHSVLPGVQFLIAGDAYAGEERFRTELIQLIAEKQLSETVRLLGQVEDMSHFYQSIDIFILPSVQPEPFGLVLLEAMEYALPVIATNHGGPTEIITQGVDGYLVDYQKPDEMAKRIIELARDPVLRESMGRKGQEKKRKQFSMSAMVNEITDVLCQHLQ